MAASICIGDPADMGWAPGATARQLSPHAAQLAPPSRRVGAAHHSCVGAHRDLSAHEMSTKEFNCKALARTRLNPPHMKVRADRWRAGLLNASDHGAPVQRRVWQMIPFGTGLEMLVLNMLTLNDVVDGFLVTEARHTFTRRPKPAVLTEALAAGEVPAALAAKLHVEVVDLHLAATSGG